MKLGMKIRLFSYPILLGGMCLYLFYYLPSKTQPLQVREAKIQEWIQPLAVLGKNHIARHVSLPAELEGVSGYLVRFDQGKGETLAYVCARGEQPQERRIMEYLKTNEGILPSGETTKHLVSLPLILSGLPSGWTIVTAPVLPTPSIPSTPLVPESASQGNLAL